MGRVHWLENGSVRLRVSVWWYYCWLWEDTVKCVCFAVEVH